MRLSSAPMAIVLPVAVPLERGTVETTVASDGRNSGMATFSIRTRMPITEKMTKKPPMFISHAARRSFFFARARNLLFMSAVSPVVTFLSA